MLSDTGADGPHDELDGLDFEVIAPESARHDELAHQEKR
jgi:hypothetical protein